MIVGVVLLSFGVGNCIGSIGGGRWSDMVLKKLKAKNGGKGEPEVSLLASSFQVTERSQAESERYFDR